MAAVTEWDLIDYGRRQMEYRRRKRRPILRAVESMRLEEVIERAQEIYSFDITLAAAHKWVGRGLVQAPSIEGQGKNRGVVAHYSADSPAQMATAAYMAELRFTQRDVAQAREWTLEGIEVPEALGMALSAGTSPGAAKDYGIAEQVAGHVAGAWGSRDISPKARHMVRCLTVYARTLILARAGRDPLWPFGEYRTVQIEAGRVLYIVSLPGVWIDARHAVQEELLTADTTVRLIHGED